jgi:hypothetical protein
LSVADKIEIATWCRIHGPLPILRPGYHAALIAAVLHNSTLTQKTQHLAKGVSDFLLWGDKPDTLEDDIVKAMAKMGIAKKKGNVDGSRNPTAETGG